MAEIVNLGSLYLNGQPIDLGVEYNGEVLSFGNTIPGKTIPFVKWGKLLVASQCVCINIRWDELNKAGYIFGRPVKIDGVPYLCRSLKVGKKEGDPNEWDDILDELGEDDSIWHWDEQGFFGQEREMNVEGHLIPVLRGKASARTYIDEQQVLCSAVLGGLGFRPVLEPYGTPCPIAETLVGQKINLFIGNGLISGTLKDFNDYDLTLNVLPDSSPDIDSAWMIVCDNGDVIIDRSQIRLSCLVKEGLG